MLSIRSILLAGTLVLVANTVSLADPSFTPPGPPPQVPPEPIDGSTAALFGVGFMALIWVHSRMKKTWLRA